MIQLCNISKSYLARPILLNLSYTFNNNTYALSGVNGSGKTTLLSLISGAVALDSGDILINGVSLSKDPLKAKSQIGFIPDDANFYPFLSGREMLQFICAVKRVNCELDKHDLVRLFQIQPYMDTQLAKMSLGTKKKFFIVAGLISDSKVVLMDEPTNSLDEKAKGVLCKYINTHLRDKTVLFSTHDEIFIRETAAIPLHFHDAPIKQIYTQPEAMDALTETTMDKKYL